MLIALALLACSQNPSAADSALGDCDTPPSTPWYPDADGDGYGEPGAGSLQCPPAQGVTFQPGDCDDSLASVFPGAPERCDGVDNDCDGLLDNEPVDGLALFRDADNDGYGDPLSPISACDAHAGAVSQAGDCDDTDPGNHPGGEEVCDGSDNDCDGLIDWGHRVPQDFNTISQAMDQAEHGDTVCVGPGSWRESLDFDDRELRVIGAEGPERTRIDGRGDSPVVDFLNSPQGTLLQGFTVTGGLIDDTVSGAGVRVVGGAVTLKDLEVSGNRCEVSGYGRCFGVGLYAQDGEVALEDVYVIENTAEGWSNRAAGVGLVSATFTARRSSLSDNTAGTTTDGGYVEGAGMWAVDSHIQLFDSHVDNNRALSRSADGAGVLTLESTLQIEGSSVSGNLCEGHRSVHGCGLTAIEGALELTDSQLNSNQVQTVDGVYGGTLYLSDTDATLTSVRIDGNTATSDNSNVHGGVIALYGFNGGTTTFDRVTLTGNALSAGTVLKGSALYSNDARPTLQGLSVTGTTADAGEEAWGTLWFEGEGLGRLFNSQVSGNILTGGTHCIGHGAVLSAAEMSWRNVEMAGNSCSAHSGVASGLIIALEGSELNLRNASLVANHSEGQSLAGSGLTVVSASQAVLRNVSLSHSTSAFRSGVDGALLCGSGGDISRMTYSNLFENSGTTISGCSARVSATGNQSVPPGFMNTGAQDPADWDLRLTSGSPLINAGDISLTDPDGTRSDIGAHGGPDANDW